jgi:hypothetical protein
LNPTIKVALDPLLFDTYKRYRAGTIKLVSWLASTARKTKLVDDVFLAKSETMGKGRLKGKARKAPKSDSQQIRTADITRIAEVIATTKIDGVPDTLIRTLEDVIGARKECAGWFASVRAIPVSDQF